MEINYLKEFVVLAQTGNFMEAAEMLYVSQSTLSKHIKSIEVELGVSLFDRTTRKVTISKYGQLLLPYAQQIAELQEMYISALRTSLENEQETLTLGRHPRAGAVQYHRYPGQFQEKPPPIDTQRTAGRFSRIEGNPCAKENATWPLSALPMKWTMTWLKSPMPPTAWSPCSLPPTRLPNNRRSH